MGILVVGFRLAMCYEVLVLCQQQKAEIESGRVVLQPQVSANIVSKRTAATPHAKAGAKSNGSSGLAVLVMQSLPLPLSHTQIHLP